MLVENMKIIKNKEIARDIYELVVEGENTKKFQTPGQFVNIQIDSNHQLILRRPFSICEVNKDLKQFKILYQIKGEGTKVLSKKSKGEVISIFGPLGNGFPISHHQDGILLIGGGIGIAPLYELAKQLFNQGKKVIAVLGFASIDNVIYVKAFKQYSEVHVATMDGSDGFKGNVLECIQSKKLNFDTFYSCGPISMLKAIQKEYKNKKRGFVSLEKRMACGVGACYACVCESNHSLRVCKEGPVFNINEGVI